MVGAIVGTGDLLNVSSGVFMGQDESVLDVFSSSLLAFTLNEGGNLKSEMRKKKWQIVNNWGSF